MNNQVKVLPPRNWRTQAMHDKYTTERARALDTDFCPFCDEEPAAKFNFWSILPNKYPYDGVAIRHDLLSPLRHIATFDLLNQAELAELVQLKETVLNSKYAFMMEPMLKNKSIPGHFHFHLIEPKVIN